jgi:predicted TPR repeat methyltransferase
MDAQFEQAKSLFLEGVGHFEGGRYEEAEHKFRASLKLLPGRPSTMANLAATCTRRGRPAQALDLLEEVLAVAPGDIEAWSYRADALAALGRHEEALACHDKLVELDAGRAAGWYQRGLALARLRRLPEALSSFERALAIDPGLAQAWTHRGSILKDLERPQEAAASFEEAMTRGADPEVNRYFLAALRPGDAPPIAPARYVEFLFDDYADTFDHHLVEVLKYQAHTVLVDRLKALCGECFARALDLGCGTGLCGSLLASWVDEIDGVDLSGSMIAKARARGVYARLAQADVAQHLQAVHRRYDLVLAADVFIYVGDLAQVYAGVRRVLEPGGVFCFSVESAADSVDFELRPSLRYAHSERYVRQLAARYGFEVAKLVRQPVREEQQQPIAGLYAYLVRP